MDTLRQWIKRLRSDRRFDPNSGQIIVLLVFMSVGLVAIMGLAIDGGRLLFLRRDTQNAADAAAVAAARALCTMRDPAPYALSAAAANGFDNNRTDNWVDVFSPPHSANFTIPSECSGCYVEVNVKGTIPSTFIGVVYKGELAATGHAIGVCNPDRNLTDDAPELRALWAMSQSCNPMPVTVTGSDITIVGGAHSNADMKIMPNNSSSGECEVTGATSVVKPKSASEYVHGQDKITWCPGGATEPWNGTTPTGRCEVSCFTDCGCTPTDTPPADGTPYVSSVKPNYPVPFKIEDFQGSGKYKVAAEAAGQFYEFNCSGKFWDWVLANHYHSGVLDTGIYYAACDMDITKSADTVSGQVTFVTTGDIDVKGDGQQWEPYPGADNLLLFANANDGCNGNGAIKFAGNHNSWNGIVFAPGGSIKISGSTNDSAAGCLVGLSVEVSGARNRIICAPANAPNPKEPGLWLAE